MNVSESQDGKSGSIGAHLDGETVLEDDVGLVGHGEGSSKCVWDQDRELNAECPPKICALPVQSLRVRLSSLRC